MKRIFLFIILFSQISSAEQSIEFKKDGKVIKSLSMAELSKLATKESLAVWEPHSNKDVTYKGYSPQIIFDKIFGQDWHQSEIVVFTCADGYKDPIPMATLESERNLLAIAKADNSDFTVNNRFQSEKNIPLTPLYLVWNNLKNSQIRAEAATNWPYQIVGIELTSFANKFPHMIPPAKSSLQVKQGFQAFQKYCMTCHKIHGDGGDKGPELGNWKNHDNSWLAKWIDDPTKIRPTTMPALNARVKNRTQTIQNIISYLDAIKK